MNVRKLSPWGGQTRQKGPSVMPTEPAPGQSAQRAVREAGAGQAPLLRVEGIHAGYGKKEILHGITLEVNPGEVVLLAGANGAGKSTLLKVIAGLLKPTSGHVYLNGVEITGLPAGRRARQGVGYLLQGGEVFPSLTVWENLTFAMGNRTGEPELIEPVLSLFPPLRAKLRQRAGLLSGGERQMLALAMVLIRQPGMLLLDEPTAALAPALAAETLRRVGDYCQEQRTAVLLVEQRLRDAFAIAHRCLIMASGRAAPEFGSPGVLLVAGRLDDLLFGMRTGASSHELLAASRPSDPRTTGDL